MYSVFRRQDSWRKAVIVVNPGPCTLTAKVSTGRNQTFIVVSPENPEPRIAGTQVQIPSRSAVVVMETGDEEKK